MEINSKGGVRRRSHDVLGNLNDPLDRDGPLNPHGDLERRVGGGGGGWHIYGVYMHIRGCLNNFQKYAVFRLFLPIHG